MTIPAIHISELTKIIKGQRVLQDIDLEVTSGDIVGITGRNGSGKTMLFRVICGLVRPTSGKVNIFGVDITEKNTFPQNIGAIIEHPSFLPQYSGFRNLKLLASIRGLLTDQEIVDVMKQVGLDPRNRKPFYTYSQGMRQRLGLAQAVMEKPRLLILDEPTNGLDVQGVEMFRNLVLQLRQEQGVTVLMASHYKEDISTLCDVVYRMENGRLTEQIVTGRGTPQRS